MKFDPDKFTETLPYSSELFGVYQPLIGWKSRQISVRLRNERQRVHDIAAARLLRAQARMLTRAAEGVPASATSPTAAAVYPVPAFDCCVARFVAAGLKPGSLPTERAWKDLLAPAVLQGYLHRAQVAITAYLETKHIIEPVTATYLRSLPTNGTVALSITAVMAKEMSVIEYLQWLAANTPATLEMLFFHAPQFDINEYLYLNDPLLNFGSSMSEAVLSPIGVVHLFRQYFFEFDNFLGTPVGHLWISPGGTVELVEVHSRRTLTERTLEAMLETTQRSETNTTNQDELSEAVRDENTHNTSLGVSATATYTIPTFQASATTNLNLTNSRTSARETTHKHMRQQSEKLSSEIKQNFKSTFKTTQEVTDTSSKRYVVQNTSVSLVNYELRRKMRQIGVQVQDIGTQLCWQVYVDIPGTQLGIAELVHIAEPADVDQFPAPELAQPLPKRSDHFSVEFLYQTTSDDEDETQVTYVLGNDGQGNDGNATTGEDTIVWKGQATFDVPAGYTELDGIDGSAVPGFDADVVVTQWNATAGTLSFNVPRVNFHGQKLIKIQFDLNWKGVPLTPAQVKANTDATAQNTAAKNRAALDAYRKAARERINLAGQVTPRPSEELREEERIIVYRNLIGSLMTVGVQNPHITSELVRQIFDVDKMLYFVAPEWWQARVHSKQTLGNTVISDDDVVSWGGPNAKRDDNYFITEDSAPARMGSSLGWLLQLDGDTLRNAFLNSPWVKAVIPIRVGQEDAAINWLQHAHVEGSDGLDAVYQASAEDIQEIKDKLKNTDGTLAHPGTVTIQDAIRYLAQKVAEINAVADKPAPFDLDPEPDPTKKKLTMPTEVVYEHGFYPLQGGMKLTVEPLKVFTQWLEILPTDQVVALEYHPQDHL